MGFEEKEQLGGRPIDLDSLASSISGDPASIFSLREGRDEISPGLPLEVGHCVECHVCVCATCGDVCVPEACRVFHV